jgi:hypothetical protein
MTDGSPYAEKLFVPRAYEQAAEDINSIGTTANGIIALLLEQLVVLLPLHSKWQQYLRQEG